MKQHMGLCGKQNRSKQSKIGFTFLDFSNKPPFALMTTFHTVSILSDSYMRYWPSVPFQSSWRVTFNAEHLLTVFLSKCCPAHLKPSELGLGWLIVEAESSDVDLHHSPSWSNSPHIAWRCFETISLLKNKRCSHKAVEMAGCSRMLK